MESLPQEVSKVLYFWVAKSSDIFYQKELSSIENLKTHIFLSREESSLYHFGRIDVSNLGFPMDTEFYICWNPAMIQSSSDSLRSQWYVSIFHEFFS
jgi:NAD(P)H-flavin reductase